MNIQTLFANNKKWSRRIRRQEPAFFKKLSRLQKPEFLWIGCSDSRVPANEITGLLPGELFVHRNVGNIVYPNDLNCSSVLQYAIDVLKIKYIIVCGHYNCGGVKAVVENQSLGESNAWLNAIRQIQIRHRQELIGIKKKSERIDRLCEFNVVQQARNVCDLPFVRRAWKKGYPLTIHAWIYDLNDGLIKELRRYKAGR